MSYNIRLTNGGSALVDKEDFYIVNQYKWYFVSDHCNKYAYTNINDTTMKMHRLIMQPNKDEIIDHKNGNGLDNRKNNLIKCDNQRNSYNRKPSKNKKLPQGVSFHHSSNKKYRVRIKFKKTEISLGTYNNKNIASKIYCDAKLFRNLYFNLDISAFRCAMENLKKDYQNDK